MSQTSATMPNPGSPILDKNGRLSPEWFGFFLALLQRTGGEGTPPSTTEVDYSALLNSFVPLPAPKVDPVGFAPIASPYVRRDVPDAPVPTHGIQDAPDLHALATSTTAGFMGPADKAKLDSYAAAIEDKFVAGVNFSAGSTTSLTLSKAYASPAAVMVHFDGVFQGSDQYTISGTTITFNSAIPVGTTTVYARG